MIVIHESKYEFIPVTVSDTDIEVNCFTIGFRNQGDSTVLIDDVMKIEPGETVSLGDNTNKNINDSFNIKFTGGTTNELILVKEISQKRIVTGF